MFGGAGLEFAAGEDSHVAEYAAIGLFVAEAGDVVVPFLPVRSAATRFG